MRVCGVEIKGSEANICLLTLDKGVFHVPDCRARKLTHTKQSTAEELKAFQFAFAKLMEDYKVEKVVIRERPAKGKFAGSAMGFKMEAAMELIDDLDVSVMSAAQIKASLKRNPVHIPFNETGLKIFQETAFNTAFAFLMNHMYPPGADESEE